MDQKELIDKITQEVVARLRGQNTESPGSGPVHSLTSSELAAYIDHTLLKPEAPAALFDKLVEEALKYKFFSVCVNSSWVPYVARKVRGSEVKVCSVIGFPLG